nr:hypothetical protein [uncultured Flavobacterium sp.]
MLVFAAVILLFSCTKGKSTDIDFMTKKAEEHLKRHPDSTLIYTQKVLAAPAPKGISDPERLELYGLRQKAFAATENMDSVVAVGKKIRVLAAEISDSLAIANSLLPVRGDIDFSSQQEMTTYLPGAIATFKENNMPFEAAKLSASYGTILCHKGDFVQAQTYLLDSYRVLNKLDSVKSIINVCMNIGSTFYNLKSTKKSLEYYTKAYNAAMKTKDSSAITSVLINIGNFYSDGIKNQDKALQYYQRALQYVPKKSGDYLKMKIDYNVAVTSFKKGDLYFSERTFQSMLADCIKNQAYEGVAMASKGLGDLYVKKEQPDKALLYLTRAIHLADSLQMSYEALQMRPSLLALYKKTNNYHAALQVSEKMKTSNDSILSAEKQNAVHELEIKYQSEKKATEISQLKALSKSRQLMLYGLSFFMAVLFFMWYKKNKLHKEKTVAYSVLMKKYRDEKEKKQRLEINSPFTEPIQSNQENASEDILLFTILNNYFQQEKPYLDSKLKVEQVAKKLQLPQRNIITALRAGGYTSFTSFTNKHRIDEVKTLFEDPNLKHYKIEALALKSGFGAKQSFYNTFERFTGVKPSYYRTEILKTNL